MSAELEAVLKRPDVGVMGVINLSPESANRFTVAANVGEASEMAARYREWGADIIDVGAQSSRYQTKTLSVQEEIGRLFPTLEKLVADGHIISVDTWKPEVAAVAIGAGAQIINDTGGLEDPQMLQLLADAPEVYGISVYVEGKNPHAVGEVEVVDNKAARIATNFAKRLETLTDAGVEKVIIDPGIAINYRGDYQAYTRLQIQVVRQLTELRRLGRPVLVPIPRKQNTAWVHAYISLAIEYGADLIRVHDVEAATQIADLLAKP